MKVKALTIVVTLSIVALLGVISVIGHDRSTYAQVSGIATSSQLMLTSVDIPKGDVGFSELSANSFISGLSGFTITISTSDPTIAIPKLFNAPNYGLVSVEPLSDSSLRISVVDLNRLVEPGAVDVVLGTLTLEALSPGATSMIITVKRLDDEDGYPIPRVDVTTSGMVAVTSPKDLDGDGITEDINGNGIFDFDDVVRLFELLVQ